MPDEPQTPNVDNPPASPNSATDAPSSTLEDRLGSERQNILNRLQGNEPTPQATPPAQPPEQPPAQPPEPGQPAETPEQPETDWTDALASQFGIQKSELEGFSNEEAARSAISQRIRQLADMHRESVERPTPTSQPAQPPAQPAEQPKLPSVDLKALGLEEDDAAAKAIKALEQQFSSALENQQKQFAERFSSFEQQRQEMARAQTQAEFDSVVDSWNSPKYGKTGQRSFAQRVAYQELQNMANQLVYAADATQAPIPSPGERASTSRVLLDGTDATVRQQQEQQQQQVLNSRQPAPQAVQGGIENLKMTESWVDNEELMRAVRGLE